MNKYQEAIIFFETLLKSNNLPTNNQYLKSLIELVEKYEKEGTNES